MTTQEQRSVPTPVVGALGLLALGLVLLGVGGFVQFDDTSGFGSDQWNLPLGIIAVPVGVAAIGVASVSAQSRRWLGGALVLLDLFLTWQRITDDGFRFVFHGDEGSLSILQVLIALVALVLIATGFQPLQRPAGEAGRWLVRVAAYVCGSVVVAAVALVAGVQHYDTKVCTNDDCDLGLLEGMFWSLVALGICVAVAVVIEVVLLVKRRQRRTEGQPA